MSLTTVSPAKVDTDTDKFDDIPHPAPNNAVTRMMIASATMQRTILTPMDLIVFTGTSVTAPDTLNP